MASSDYALSTSQQRRTRTNALTNTTRLTAHSTAIVCQDIDIKGEITIGANCVIHPKATIYALNGPIVIGEGCVVEEMAVIFNRRKEVMRIGKDNRFMVACRVESPSIGDHNTFQPRSKVSSSVSISHHCTLGAGTILLPLNHPLASTSTSAGSAVNDDNVAMEEMLPYTVVYGEMSKMRMWDGNGEEQERLVREKESEFLREIIPKFNRMRVV